MATDTRTHDDPQQPHEAQRTPGEPAAPVEPVHRRIPLADIIVDPEVQAREVGNTAARLMIETTTEEYFSAMFAGAVFPPLIVFEGPDGIVLADGFTRYEAATRSHVNTIDCEVRPGSRRDASLYAAGANHAHGLRRTNDDKRKAATRLLCDPEWGKWSANEIARICKVSQPFVSALRTELVTSNVISEPGARKVKTKNGKTIKMKVGKIGKRKKKLTAESPKLAEEDGGAAADPDPAGVGPGAGAADPVAAEPQTRRAEPEQPTGEPDRIRMDDITEPVQMTAALLHHLLGDDEATKDIAQALLELGSVRAEVLGTALVLCMLDEDDGLTPAIEDGHDGGRAGDARARATVSATGAVGDAQPPKAEAVPGGEPEAGAKNSPRALSGENFDVTTQPIEPEPDDELPPERRLDDDEFSVLWTLEDGNITVERATKGKRLYSHDLDAPTVLARLKRRKLIQVRKGKMLLTKLGRELMTEADQEPKRHCEQMKFAANTALKAGKHVWKYDGAWYAILKPQEGDDPTDYPYIYDNDDKFGPYATAAEAEAAWAEDNAKAEEPGSS